MPRFAFALPYRPERGDAWRAAAERLLADAASEHRVWLLDRGIFRERIWTQQGEGAPPVTMFLWDCDDIRQATRLDPTMTASREHERWLTDMVLGDFHGIDAAEFAFPVPEVLSGTTTQATAAAGSHTMFAIPVDDEAVDAVRTLVDRIEVGDLSTPHSDFLNEAGIREEWIWLQPGFEDVPAMLLTYWIGDDLSAALTRFAEDAHPYARVMRDALFGMLLGVRPATVASWEVDQLVVMHVRRSDSAPHPLQPYVNRWRSALEDGRWDALARVFETPVRLVRGGTARDLGPADAIAVLQEQIGASTVHDALTSADQILLPMTPHEAGSTRLALLIDVAQRRVTSVQVIDAWPPP